MKENDYLLRAPIPSLLKKFAIPCIISLLISSLYNIVDQIFIGNSSAGTAGVMATTLVFPFTVVALAIALLLGDGAASLYSIALGEKKLELAKKSVGTTILSLLVSSIVLMLLGFIFKDQILALLGVAGFSPECQAFTNDYYSIILAGIPFSIFVSGSASLIRASGAPTYSTIATVTGAVINIVFDPIMIFGLNLGVRGAAIATIAGQIVSSLLCIKYFLNLPRSKTQKEAESSLTSELVKLSPSSFSFNPALLARIFKLGITSFITQLAVVIISIVANNVIGSVGADHATDAGSALGIVFKIFGIALSFSIGIAVGGQPIVGYNYGARRSDRVLETLKYVLLGNLVVGLIAFMLFEFLPLPLVRLFGGNASDLAFYEDYAVSSFRIYLGGITLCCLTKAATIFLQSIEKPVQSMLLSLSRDVIVLVPAVILLGHAGGLYGMLWAGPLADLVAGILTTIILIREIRILKHAPNSPRP